MEESVSAFFCFNFDNCGLDIYSEYSGFFCFELWAIRGVKHFWFVCNESRIYSTSVQHVHTECFAPAVGYVTHRQPVRILVCWTRVLLYIMTHCCSEVKQKSWERRLFLPKTAHYQDLITEIKSLRLVRCREVRERHLLATCWSIIRFPQASERFASFKMNCKAQI